MANQRGKNENSERFYFLGLQNHCGQWLQLEMKTLASWNKSYDKPRKHIKKHSLHSTNKGPYSQSYGFSSYHVWIWDLDHKEGWVLKNWCLLSVGLKKTLEIPWNSRRHNQPILKEINPEYSLERLMLRLQYFGYLMWRANSSEKNPHAGKNWRQKGRVVAESETVRWHHWFNEYEFKRLWEISEDRGPHLLYSGQGYRRESDMI